MTPIRLSQLNTWARHETNAREVLLEALSSLKEEKSLPLDENEISRQLFIWIRRVNNRLVESGKGIPHPITYQAQNPPDPSTAQATPSEYKIPDFQWGMIDQTVEDPEKRDRYLTIECKRLGKLPSGHSLNVKYVEQGLLRFITEEHRYGKDTDCGILIGYVQNMDLDIIWNEVGVATGKYSIPSIILSPAGWQKRGISILEHILDRSFNVTPFLLRHYWVDLRHCYPTSSDKRM